ncbi:MAG TPA: PHP domain-containing protein [Vicinamibacterales bacterium]
MSRVDLHLHTTASDGRCSPLELVEQAAAAGVSVMAATDHDTTASVDEVRVRAAERGIDAIPGIEITAVEDGRDVHVLGYFLRTTDPSFLDFLSAQRRTRVDRVHAIAGRLAELGMPIDLSDALAVVGQQSGRAIGRPQVARAMVAAGHVADTREAFDKWLGSDQPAFVPRSGPSPEMVIQTIHRAGGLASLAHPGRTRIDARIPALRDAGLDALEAYHSDHDAVAAERYHRLADDLGLLITGGSDYHGDPVHGVSIGSSTLPSECWQRLHAARHRHAAG